MIDGIFDLGAKVSLQYEMHDNNEADQDPPLQRVKDVLLETICQHSRIARLFAKEA